MKLHLIREPSTIICTPGVLFVNGRFECFTLEDVVREIPNKPVAAWKIKGHTAIPSGDYRVEITVSPRFKRELPLLLGVPGFEGIRIHPGNTAEHTEGCILVGKTRQDADPGIEGIEAILGSRLAFDPLFARMKEANGIGEDISIEIRNGFEARFYNPLAAA